MRVEEAICGADFIQIKLRTFAVGGRCWLLRQSSLGKALALICAIWDALFVTRVPSRRCFREPGLRKRSGDVNLR